MLDRLLDIRRLVAQRRPLVHCLMGPISINDCANGLLAVGARPIMAEHPEEVAQITGGADALLLNLGGITDSRMTAMEIAADVASARQIPMVLDLVGVACSSLRLGFAQRLIDRYTPALVKGNRAEVAARLEGRLLARGVDARESDLEQGLEPLLALVTEASRIHGAAVLVSGPVDVIADCRTGQATACANGHPMLAGLTGTGCLLGALTAAFSTAASPLDAGSLATLLEGVAGELAAGRAKGVGSFRVELLDALSTVSDGELRSRARLGLE